MALGAAKMNTQDRTILRDLAKKVADLAALPLQEEKRKVWQGVNELKPRRPALFCSPEGSWGELLPDNTLKCREEAARGLEWGLRLRLYAAEHFCDDQVCDRDYFVGCALRDENEPPALQYIMPAEARGAYVWEPLIKTHQDLDKLAPPALVHDQEKTQQNLAFHEELWGDILQVRLRGAAHLSGGLIDDWARLRGLTQTFLDMTDDPNFVQAGMQRMLENRQVRFDFLEAQNLLGLNNGNHYIGSGALGYTRELPAADFDGRVRLKDLWGFADAQTMSEVSPVMQERFVLPYQIPILERFGLNCYGCCEPLHHLLPALKRRLPRLRRVSISPWADKRISAQELGPNIVFSWKPNPAYLAGVHFNPELVRKDIRETLDIAKEHGNVLEIVLKDTHTCNNEPWRFDKWLKIAREEIMRSVE